MRKSILYETIIKKLVEKKKRNSSFTRNDIRDLISKHQKYSVFIYKHSDLKNKDLMTLFFIRDKKINNLLSFRVDNKIYQSYKKLNKI